MARAGTRADLSSQPAGIASHRREAEQLERLPDRDGSYKSGSGLKDILMTEAVEQKATNSPLEETHLRLGATMPSAKAGHVPESYGDKLA